MIAIARKLIRRVLTVLAVVAILAMGFSSPSYAATPARFVFETPPSRGEFVVELTDESKIQQARDILSGKEEVTTHIMGKIIKTPAAYNPGWSYQLDPASINFFPVAIEICDSSIEYTQDHLDEVGGAFLPGGFWCPWSSRLVKEIS